MKKDWPNALIDVNASTKANDSRRRGVLVGLPLSSMAGVPVGTHGNYMQKHLAKPPGEAVRGPILITEAAAAEMLAISPRSLWTIRNTGSIPFVRINSSIRYRVIDIEAYAEAQLSTAQGGK